MEKRQLLENVDRHLGERKERSEGIQCVEGPERRRRRRRWKTEEEGGEELKRRGGDETGKGGPVRGERGRYGGPQTAAACRVQHADWPLTLLLDGTHMHRHTHP